MNGFMAESGGRSAGHPSGRGARRKMTPDERAQRTALPDDPQSWDDLLVSSPATNDEIRRWTAWTMGPFCLVAGVVLISGPYEAAGNFIGAAFLVGSWVAARVKL